MSTRDTDLPKDTEPPKDTGEKPSAEQLKADVLKEATGRAKRKFDTITTERKTKPSGTGPAIYQPGQGRGRGLPMSTARRAQATQNQQAQTKAVEERAEKRRRTNEPYNERFRAARAAGIDYAKAASKHEEWDDYDAGKLLRDVSVDDVSYGYDNKSKDGILFRVMIPKGHGACVIGKIEDDGLFVFHIGPSGNGEFKSIE